VPMPRSDAMANTRHQQIVDPETDVAS